MKRIILLLLALSLVFSITACGGDSGDSEIVKETDQNIDIEDKNLSEEISDEPDIDEVIESISYNIGENDELVDVIVDGNDIFIKVKLDESNDLISQEDLAFSRYSSITDELLSSEYWEDISVEFLNIGIIEMNSNQAEANKYGKYFNSLEIKENFKSN